MAGFLRVLVPAFLVVLFPALESRAATAEWPIPRGPSREPVPYHYRPHDEKKVPREFVEDASAYVIYSGTSYIVEDDGTIEATSHEISRLNGRKGIESLGEYRSIAFDPAYQKATLNVARVIKADGRSVPVEPRHVQVRDLGTDYLVYDQDKQVVISFPNLEVGDLIEVKWTTRGKNPEHMGQFFTRYTFGDDHYPVARDELRVRLPKNRSLKQAVIGGKVDTEVKENGQNRDYLWRVNNRKELPKDENLPPKEDLRLQVACSTFASWEEIGRWKGKLREEGWKITPEIAAVVREVTKNLKTPTEKARALTYWVRRHIRYVSLGAEKHDYTPHPPALVLANRFGDCKDQSQLLAVMLREAKISVSLATLGTLEDGQVLEKVPSPWGTHAILLATIDGKDHWIDTTVSFAGWDSLPRDDRDRVCYVVNESGIRLLRTPAMTPEENRRKQTTHLTIGSDGSSHSEQTVVYQGAAALTQRNEWLEVPPGERRRTVAAELQTAHSRARLIGLDIDESALKDFDAPVKASLGYEIPGHFKLDGEHEESLTDNVIWARILSDNLDFDRKSAMDLGSPFESVQRYTIDLPPAYRFDSVPKERKVESRWGVFVLKVYSTSARPRRLDLEFRTRLLKVRVEPGDFEAYQKFHEDLSQQYRVWLSLKATTDLEEAPALEAILRFLPGDKRSATILASLYHQNNRDAEARRVLRRARAFRPGDLSLWEMSVEVAADLKEQEELYEELARQFPNESKYVLALGETRIKNKRLDKAWEILEPLSQKETGPSTGSAHFQLSRICLLRKQPKEALRHFEEAARANPTSVATTTALLFKGKILEQLHQGKEACEAYRQALLIDTTDIEALGSVARLEAENKRPAESLRYLRRFIAAAEGDPEHLVHAAELCLLLERNEDAVDLASRAEGADVQSRAERVLGLAYFQRGDYAHAEGHLQKAVIDPAIREKRILSLLHLGKLDAAAKQGAEAKNSGKSRSLEEVIRLTSSLVQKRASLLERLDETKRKTAREPSGFLVCAEHFYESGKPCTNVEELIDKACTGGPDLAPVLALKGRMELDRGHLREALEKAEKAIRVDPLGSGGYYVRGRIRLERGQEGAVADLEKAVNLEGRKEAKSLHWLAAALFAKGKHKEAVAVQSEAVKLQPHDPELARQLRQFGGRVEG